MSKCILTIAIIIFSAVLIPLVGQSNYVNIEQFSVYGADKIDDTQQFDKAIEYISKRGGTLFVPKGNYYLDNSKRQRMGIYNNSYIFLISNSFKIILDEGAVLYYKNGFRGFRFRSTQDPNDKTINQFSVEIIGGQIDGIENFNKRVLNNPEIWGIVGETLKDFKVNNMQIKNFKGSAGITSYSNDYVNISNNRLINVTGNPFDLIDNHGDGIYIANTGSYIVNNNIITNDLTDNRIGRVGICIEYEHSLNGTISNNVVSGYDRGVHIELINGTATIYQNRLIGNSSGIILWNNHGNKQIIESNTIDNVGLSSRNKPILYTASPILMLGHNTNNNTVIKDNTVVLQRGSFIPNNILQVTSSNVQIYGNTFNDNSRTLALSIAQGKNSKERVSNIDFSNNTVDCKSILVFDGSNVRITNNTFNVEEGIFSFDNSNNYLKNNSESRQAVIKKLGKYSR